jgi:hypothetical protein
MRSIHDDFEFDVNDEWWAEAGMKDFVPKAPAYNADLSRLSGQTVYCVQIEEVTPVRRNLSHGVFNDDAETGRTAKDRVTDILRGFRSGAAIPPVEVMRLRSDSRHTYELKRGAHKFYLSVAAGFTHVPAIIKRDD